MNACVCACVCVLMYVVVLESLVWEQHRKKCHKKVLLPYRKYAHSNTSTSLHRAGNMVGACLAAVPPQKSHTHPHLQHHHHTHPHHWPPLQPSAHTSLCWSQPTVHQTTGTTARTARIAHTAAAFLPQLQLSCPVLSKEGQRAV